MDAPKGPPYQAPRPRRLGAFEQPREGQKVKIIAGGEEGGFVEGFELDGALCVAGKRGALFITREIAKEFFGLVEPLREGCK